jgi:hypothetical protein
MSKRAIIKWLEELGFVQESQFSNYWNFPYLLKREDDYGLRRQRLYISFNKRRKKNYIKLDDDQYSLEDLTEKVFFDYLKTVDVLKGEIRKIKLKDLGI